MYALNDIQFVIPAEINSFSLNQSLMIYGIWADNFFSRYRANDLTTVSTTSRWGQVTFQSAIPLQKRDSPQKRDSWVFARSAYFFNICINAESA
jgi:hypothetical protein